MKLISVRSVIFGKYTRIGWDVLVMDTGFHPLVIMRTGKQTKADVYKRQVPDTVLHPFLEDRSAV